MCRPRLQSRAFPEILKVMVHRSAGELSRQICENIQENCTRPSRKLDDYQPGRLRCLCRLSFSRI
jgi:hypothetical protein